jgi:hypothetical protein
LCPTTQDHLGPHDRAFGSGARLGIDAAVQRHCHDVGHHGAFRRPSNPDKRASPPLRQSARAVFVAFLDESAEGHHLAIGHDPVVLTRRCWIVGGSDAGACGARDVAHFLLNLYDYPAAVVDPRGDRKDTPVSRSITEVSASDLIGRPSATSANAMAAEDRAPLASIDVSISP